MIDVPKPGTEIGGFEFTRYAVTKSILETWAVLHQDFMMP